MDLVVDDAAPLKAWNIEGSFDSAAQCGTAQSQQRRTRTQQNKALLKLDDETRKLDSEQRRLAAKGDKTAQQYVRDEERCGNPGSTPAKALRYTGTGNIVSHNPDIVVGACIATDDPRLAK